MTLPILHRTVREADPRRNYRLRDFLSTLGLHPVFVPDPGPVAAIEAAPAAEAEAPAEVPQCDCQQDPRSEGEVPAAQDVAAVIADGQAQAERGETADRGSFARYLTAASAAGVAEGVETICDSGRPGFGYACNLARGHEGGHIFTSPTSGVKTAWPAPSRLAPPAGYGLKVAEVPADGAL